MARRARTAVFRTVMASIALVPLPAGATSVWVDWAIDSATAATGSTSDGRTVAYTGHPVGTNAAGVVYDVSPTVPGAPAGKNPPYLGTVTGQPHPTVLDPGDLIMSIDLANFEVDAETTFAVADMIDSGFYRLELLDGTLAALALSSVQVTNHNITYPASGNLIADEDVTFNTSTGALRLNFIHDAGGTYRHSGLAVFTNLPLATRHIRLLSNSTAQQATEGIQIYIGGSAVPEPTSAGLMLAAVLLALARRSTRTD